MCNSIFARGGAGVSSRLRASSMVTRFSGKSRTVSVLNSEFAEIDAPLKPLPSCFNTLARLLASRYLTSKTLLLKPFSVTKLSLAGVDPAAGCCADAPETTINTKAIAARTFLVVLSMRTYLLDTFRRFIGKLFFSGLMGEPDDAYVSILRLHFDPESLFRI